MRKRDEKDNTLFVYLNPEKDDNIGDVPDLNTLYKESTSKVIFDTYSSLAQSFVSGGKYWQYVLFITYIVNFISNF